MKTLLLTLLLFSILLQSSTKSFIYTRFKANQEEITRLQCENKNNALLHCEGKCFLAKELKKEEQKQTNPFSEKEKMETLFFILYEWSMDETISHPLMHNDRYQQLSPLTAEQGVFHPPPQL